MDNFSIVPGVESGLRGEPLAAHVVTEIETAFLEGLRELGNVYQAAKRAGIQRETVYRRRAEDPEFKQAWDDALEAACDSIEGAMQRRAVNRDDMPAFLSGMALLRARRPEQYREAPAVLRETQTVMDHEGRVVLQRELTQQILAKLSDRRLLDARPEAPKDG